ncbi:MAG: rhodoquinone biosynthesis methyltransferase RquA [Formivibrio sp.]|nr:rhodoquinone biosynthesis methyltransferase RquA [Formivibrio sp.]
MPDSTLIATPDTDFYYEGVPDYMTEVYDWAYVNPSRVRLLDRNIVVRTLLFANDQRLMHAYLNEIEPGMRVWQIAHVYGDLVQRAASKTGPEGAFHLTDITPIQVEHGKKKLAGTPWSKVIRHDAATFMGEGGNYDLICSFFLLHEVPDNKKRQILDHLLSMLPKEGKLLLVDYHRPAWWQPIRWILKVVNAWLEPFANAVWRHQLSEFSSRPEQFNWQKRTIFGGVYQIVTVSHKD